MPSWWSTALVSIAIGAVGQLLLKFAARTSGGLPLAGPHALAALGRLAFNPYLLAGVVCFLTSMVLWVKVLANAPLSTAYPAVSLGYVLVVLLSWAVLGERVGLRQAVAIAVIVAGVAMLGGQARGGQ
jgi:drug/metabolite transporter (DMT)-like permease